MNLPPTATIVITTRNRREELRRALLSAVRQGRGYEVLVIDDGSTDGTSEIVRAEFPQVRLERREESRGLIVRRNEGARLARGAVVVSLDDDAEFADPRVVAQTLADFDHPRIGAVAIPFINVLQSPVVHQRAPEAGGRFVTSAFIGTAHAIRRDVFLQLGGYREHFVHQGEEGDYCLRLLAAGYLVRLGRSEPIHHYESPRRSFARMDYYGRRNDVLFALHNVPAINLPAHLAGTVFNGLRAAIHSHHPIRQCAGLAVGLWQGVREWTRGGRRPVSRRIYRLQRRLKKDGPCPLAEIEGLLPPLAS